MSTLREILAKNWDNYKKHNFVLSYQKKEVEKAINCSKNSCNSRICTSCGKRYADKWATKIAEKKQIRSHIVLTVPDILRSYFRNWFTANALFKSSNNFLKT